VIDGKNWRMSSQMIIEGLGIGGDRSRKMVCKSDSYMTKTTAHLNLQLLNNILNNCFLKCIKLLLPLCICIITFVDFNM